MSTVSESSSAPSFSSATSSAGPSRSVPSPDGPSLSVRAPRSPNPWRRLSLLVGALLLMVSCMPAHVASDTARDGESARERPSKTYHVQVRTVEAKSEADRAVSDVMTWFDGLDRDERPLPLSRVSTVPVDVRWKAPFYRVRVGPFTSKEAAESVLQSVQRRFPDAFIAKEIIEEDPESRRTFWYDTPAGSLDDWDRDRDWDRSDWQRDNWDRDAEKREDGKREDGKREDWKRNEQRRDAVERARERLERDRERLDRDRERQRRGREREERREPSDDVAENSAAENGDADGQDDEEDDGGW